MLTSRPLASEKVCHSSPARLMPLPIVNRLRKKYLLTTFLFSTTVYVACAESKCVKYKHHFDHCQERVQEGKGQKGEDCVEEMFHLMHCVDGCVSLSTFSS